MYEYANRLAKDGNKVIIANSIFSPCHRSFVVEALRCVHALVRFMYRFLLGKNSCKKWFDLERGVSQTSVWTFSSKFIPRSEIYVATAAITSSFLLEYDVPENNKIYFIQGYENWNLTEEELRRTYHYPFVKIVISKWLGRIMEEEGVDYSVIPNGFSAMEYHCFIPVEQRDKFHVSLMYHTMPSKNVNIAFDALNKVKSAIPELHVSLFGVFETPNNLPDWYTYYKTPDILEHNRINNEASIYVAPSSSEGFGLTVGEAMMCGQAVVCTDTMGYLEMAVDGRNACVSPIGDVDSMAYNIIRLIQDDELRIRIAKTGIEDISSFSLENSYRLFKQAIGL